MKRFPLLSFISLTSIILLVVAVAWLNRAVFLAKFDYAYVRYFYDHSHWAVSLSQRKMGDALLYQLAGYELVTKHSFTEINPEAPPLGKYFMGWSIVLTGNPFIVNFGLYSLLLVFVWLVSGFVMSQPWQRWLAVWLVAWQPLVWGQLTQSMLDLGQVSWLMGWLWGVLVLQAARQTKQKWLATLIMGICLGAFISTKIAFFIIPLIVLVGGWLCYRKQWWWLGLSLGIAGGVYGVMYLPQVWHDGISAALSLQKWILNYWLISRSRAVPGITLLVLLSGFYIGHWQHARWTWLYVWHPTWMLTLVGVLVLWWRKKIKMTVLSPAHITVGLCLIALILCLSLVPLFDRYLLLIVPVLAITFAWSLMYWRKFRNVAIGLAVLWSVGQTVWLLPPSLTEMVKEMQRVASVPTYQELWAFVDAGTQRQYSRDQFWRMIEETRYQGQLEQVSWEVDVPRWSHNWMTEVPITIKVVQHHPLGSFEFFYPATLRRADGRWQLVWDWSLFLPAWQPGLQLKSDITPHNARVVDSKGTILAQDGQAQAVLVIPGKIKDEGAMNADIERLTGIGKPRQELRYKVGHLSEKPQFIGLVQPQSLSRIDGTFDPGVEIRPWPGREYNTRLLANPSQLDRVLELERTMNVGTVFIGELKIVDPTRPDWSQVLYMTEPFPVPDLTL